MVKGNPNIQRAVQEESQGRKDQDKLQSKAITMNMDVEFRTQEPQGDQHLLNQADLKELHNNGQIQVGFGLETNDRVDHLTEATKTCQIQREICPSNNSPCLAIKGSNLRTQLA